MKQFSLPSVAGKCFSEATVLRDLLPMQPQDCELLSPQHCLAAQPSACNKVLHSWTWISLFPRKARQKPSIHWQQDAAVSPAHSDSSCCSSRAKPLQRGQAFCTLSNAFVFQGLFSWPCPARKSSTQSIKYSLIRPQDMIRPQTSSFKETMTTKDQTSKITEDWNQNMSYEANLQWLTFFKYQWKHSIARMIFMFVF